MNYNENISKIKQKNMDYHKLPNLNETVLAALRFFEQNKPPRLKTKDVRFPLVVGSGNAYNTGKIIFSKQAAVFANESDLKSLIRQYQPLLTKKIISEMVVISASGEKDSVWELGLAKKLGLKNSLLTCSPQSSAARLADRVFVYRKLPEPYTYNVSTYLGMVLSATNEDVKKITSLIRGLKLPKHFNNYRAYAFILPDKFAAIAPMLEIKRHELFGPNLSVRAFTDGEARHAKFVHPTNSELVISFGTNKYFGAKNSRLEISLPKTADSGLLLALGYYLVGRIQAAKPPYYKKNIATFCQTGPAAYGSKNKFDLIVPGN